MRKLLTTAVLAFFTLTSFAQFSGSGSGTQSDPYKIFYPDQLNQVRNYPNQSGVYFKLMEDIDLTDWITANNPGQGWEPIGIESAPFMGVFDGNGKTLTGFTINRTSDYVGFFGYISGATVKNLTMTGEVKGGSYTGAFAGAGSGTLTGLTFNGNVTGSNYTGGIIGNSQATMTNVHVYGDVKGAQYVGGNAGQTTSTISNATITGNVTATSSYGGGIVGSTTANISTANVTGKVTGSSGYVGGIAGKSSGDITNATASGDVKGTNNIGGICGQSVDAKSFTNCCSTGNVNGSTKVGGICGEGNSTTFTNCYSYGNVTGTGNYVGGIAGRCGIDQDCCINNCISFGDVCGKYYVGGIAGEYGVTEAQPTLYEYRVYNSSGTYISYIEKLLQGNDMTQSSISNSCAIGGIEGTSYVGGVAGLIKSGSGSFQKVSAGSFNTSHYNHDGTVTTYHPDPSIYMYVHRYTKVNLNTGAINYDIEAGKCVKGTEITISEKYYNYKQVYSEISVSDCYTTGSIKGSDNVGGVVGRMEGGNINNNYSSANIIGGNYVGGIVGYLKGYEKTIASTSLTNQLVLKSNMALNTSISATGNVGRIYGSKGDNVIVGINGDTSEDNRALHDTRVIVNGVTQEILDDEQNGVNNGAAYFKLKANYVDPNHGWDFNSNWTIQETETYPYKPWQAAPPTITSALVSNDVSITGKSIDGGTVYIKIGNGEEQSVTCSGTTFTLTGIEPLKSGSMVQLYTKTNDKEASYINQYTVGYPGSGTEADPWRVYSAEDLQGVYKAGYYKQMNDINLASWISANSSTKGWVPVGYSGSGTIVYDGDNNKVTGLWTNTTDSYTGLFSSISSGTIKNLTLQLNAKKVKGGDYTGALIGRIGAGTIENVTVTGNVQGGNNTGGIVGYSTSTMLKNLSYSGQVTGSGATGGITAYVSGQPVTACQVTASTIKSTGGNVGGLIAAGNASVSQCKVTGTTVSQTGTCSSIYVAGLTANVTGSITQCHADATITNASASGYTAGLAAKSSSTIRECSAAGSVTSTGSNAKTGGLVAQTTSGTTIEDCYSTASVSGTQYTAGLVGYNYGKVNRCYASGNVSSTYYGSGLVGYNNGASAVVTNCVALGSKVEVSDQSGWGIRVIGGYTNGAPDPDESNYAWRGMQISVNGIPKQIQDNILDGKSLSDSEIKLRDSYEALYWNFGQTWAMPAGSYPVLQWQLESSELEVAKGDLSGDGKVSITDVVLIIDVIAGTITDANKVAAADVNGDGKVSISDCVAAIDLIAAQASTPSSARRKANVMLSNTDFISGAMEDNLLTISLDNEHRYTAYQMTVSMPEGMTLGHATMDEVRGADHLVTVRDLGRGRYLVAGFSADNNELTGNSGRLLTLGTRGQADADIVISNIEFATTQAEAYYLADVAVGGTPTGINEMKNEELRMKNEIYDLQGRRVTKATKGIYIHNGKKTIIK